jgi:hypothetical protein
VIVPTKSSIYKCAPGAVWFVTENCALKRLNIGVQPIIIVIQKPELTLSGFLKSKSGVVVPGQPGSQILLAHQKYWLSITNRSLMNRSVCPVDN